MEEGHHSPDKLLEIFPDLHSFCILQLIITLVEKSSLEST